MPVLPALSGKEVTRGFVKLGWIVVRRKGSQIILTKEGEMATLSETALYRSCYMWKTLAGLAILLGSCFRRNDDIRFLAQSLRAESASCQRNAEKFNSFGWIDYR